ncbi:MAG: hypothetical protein AMS24_01810 [Chlamydiae bacterium SM23_39]|nr:MAG: hypothetical protein AMS24_01810 [Chlamydiae bacterium SM23_39]
MWIESIGKKLFIKKNFYFFLLFSFIPILTSTLILGIKIKKIKSLEKQFERVYDKATKSYFSRKIKKNFFKKYQKFDPYFVTNNIESLIFMNDNKNKIKIILTHPAFASSKKLKKRRSFLEGGQNKLFFKENKTSSCLNFKESIEQQQNEIEVERDDIKRILAILEDVSISEYNPIDRSPFFQIQRITITKKNKNSFILNNLSLIKREFYEN